MTAPKSRTVQKTAQSTSKVNSSPGKPTAKEPTSKNSGTNRAPGSGSGAPKKRRLGPPAWQVWLGEFFAFLNRYRREIMALILMVAGALTIVASIIAAPSWAQVLFGWTGPVVALVMLGLGVYMLVGRRLGYWSAEALIGFELLLLAFQVGTYVWAGAPSIDGRTGLPRDGSLGGIVGASLGSLLVGAFGSTLTMILVAATAIAGALMLVRYTPLIYVMARLAWNMPLWLHSMRRTWARIPIPRQLIPRRSQLEIESAQPQTGPRFVAPYAPEEGGIQPQPASRSEERLVLPTPVGGDNGIPAPVASAPTVKTPHLKKPQKSEMITSGPEPEGGVNLPPIDVLHRDSGSYAAINIESMQRRIEATLEDFDVPVKVVHVESGPTVTQFGVEPLFVERGGQRRKIRVSRIVSLQDDLALALAAPSVRIEAPVPGRPYVGIEVPNDVKTVVALRGIMESAELRKDGGALALPLGRNTSGAPVAMDLSRAPHMLIAGSTGSGKSVCINTIVTGLLMKHSPDTLRFVMVDPKRVELTGYNGIPHLMGSVITNVEMVMPALTWLLVQMDDRYRLFREVGVRNVDSYNTLVRKENASAKQESDKKPTLPFIVLIVDELADLMMTAPEDIERQLCRLAQMARATGIHLILATQRPSVDVVTGLIKANFPTRIGFAVTSSTDSRVILDGPGAERLLGRGDMLVMKPDSAKLLRVQGCLVTDDEILRVVNFWKKQPQSAERLLGRGDMLVMKPDSAKLLRVQGCLVTDDEILRVVNFWKKQPQSAERSLREPWADLVGRDEESDDLLERALTALAGLESCSTSMLQRKLRIGYPRAARLVDQLEEMGAVGPDQGSGLGRAVLLRPDDSAHSDTIEWTDTLQSTP